MFCSMYVRGSVSIWRDLSAQSRRSSCLVVSKPILFMRPDLPPHKDGRNLKKILPTKGLAAPRRTRGRRSSSTGDVKIDINALADELLDRLMARIRLRRIGDCLRDTLIVAFTRSEGETETYAGKRAGRPRREGHPSRDAAESTPLFVPLRCAAASVELLQEDPTTCRIGKLIPFRRWTGQAAEPSSSRRGLRRFGIDVCLS